VLTVDTLRLELPAGYRDRADRVARLTARALSPYAAGPGLALDRLLVGPVEVRAELDDEAVAGEIAAAVGAALSRTRR